MANNFFGNDALEGFLNTSAFALTHISPSRGIIDNVWGVGSGLAGQAFENMDWNFDDANPEQSHEQQISAFSNSASDLSSSVDELGLDMGMENSSDPFGGIENLVGMGLGLFNPFDGF